MQTFYIKRILKMSLKNKWFYWINDSTNVRDKGQLIDKYVWKVWDR